MSKEDRDYTTVNISRVRHRQLKLASAGLGLSVKEILEEAVKEYMEKRGGLDRILRQEEE